MFSYTRPYELNIVGLRSKAFNRMPLMMRFMYSIQKPDGKWEYHIYPATTDPGTFWLNNPSFPQGTAILAQGQHVDSYSIGIA
ncbi:MAG: hypothetical protein U5K54_15520 [Cytophagales bacterium]|nr:hypothetical protein [Cytophagales bacterium]